MSVAWIEGFGVDRSANALARKYPVIGVGSGLNIIDGPADGSRAWGGQTALTFFVTPVLFSGSFPGTCSVGVRVRASKTASVPLVTMLRGAQEQVSLWIVPAASGDGWALEVRRGAFVLGRTAEQDPGIWRFVEISAACVLDGTWTVYVAGSPVASGAAQLGGYYTPGVDRVAFSVQTSALDGSCDVTDIYVTGDDGAGEVGPLGEGSAVAVRAESQGSADEWTASPAGDGVDDWKQDGVDLDSSTVRSDANGQRELAKLERIDGSTDGVAAVMFGAYGKLLAPGTRGMRVVSARDGVEAAGSGLMTFSSTADYTYSFAVEEADPADGAPWTSRAVADDEIGFTTTEP